MAARRRGGTTRGRSARRTRGRRPRVPGKDVQRPGEGYTVEEVIAALREEGGVLLFAAERLGCHRHTVANYVARYPEVAEALGTIREELGDHCERGIQLAVKTREPWALRFYARTQLRGRGYVMTNEITGPSGAPVAVEAHVALTPDDMAEQVAGILSKMGALAPQQRSAGSDEGRGT